MNTHGIEIKKAATQFLFSTVRVEAVYGDGGLGAGTAFFFQLSELEGRPTYLVTNRHVIEDADEVRLRFHIGGRAKRFRVSPFTTTWLRIDSPRSVWSLSLDPKVDLAAISVDKLVAMAAGELDDLYFAPMRSHGVPTTEEEQRYPAVLQVAMIGYPIGLWDQTNNLPLIRRGSTATHPAVNFNGRPQLVVDIACFPGSSGSPVVLYDRDYFGSVHRFLGVLYAGPVHNEEGEIVIRAIPTQYEAFTLTPIMIHLGFVIKAREVVVFTERLAGK